MKSRDLPKRQHGKAKRAFPRFRMPKDRERSPPLADELSERTYNTTQIPNQWRKIQVCDYLYCDWSCWHHIAKKLG